MTGASLQACLDWWNSTGPDPPRTQEQKLRQDVKDTQFQMIFYTRGRCLPSNDLGLQLHQQLIENAKARYKRLSP